MKIHINPLFLLLISCFLVLAGCSGKTDTSGQIWGGRGKLPGLFSTPRAIEARNGLVYVIDRTGRVQKFGAEGKFLLEWQLEKIDNGTPTGMNIDDEGNIWIPDTHNSRILQYSPQGELLLSFGSYGEEPGKFIYPTDIEFGDDGCLFITEYGKQDRVQVFSRKGEYITSWGDFGNGEEQFNRPMGISKGPDRNLYIADAINNRIKVYDQSGVLIKNIGHRGSGPGEFYTPYDVAVDGNGFIYVAEFGNHRVQKLSPDGQSVRSWGSLGSGPGQIREPWGVAVDGNWLFIADTKNHRLQVYPKDE